MFDSASERPAVENHLRELRAAARALADLEDPAARALVERHGRPVVRYAEEHGLDAACVRELLARKLPDLDRLGEFISLVYRHVHSTPHYQFEMRLVSCLYSYELLYALAMPAGGSPGFDEVWKEREAEKAFAQLVDNLAFAAASELLGDWQHLEAWRYLNALRQEIAAAVGPCDEWPTVWMRVQQIVRGRPYPDDARFERELRRNLLVVRGEREPAGWREPSRAGGRDLAAGENVHNDDFTMVRWFGVEYHFSLGLQASAVAALWREWEKNGLGLHQETIRHAIDEERDTFRMDATFRNHPAFGVMIRPCGDGRYRLARPEPGGSAQRKKVRRRQG